MDLAIKASGLLAQSLKARINIKGVAPAIWRSKLQLRIIWLAARAAELLGPLDVDIELAKKG